MKKLIKKVKGFTLTELIVVIAIIGILAAVLIPSITGYIEKANLSSDTSSMKSMNDILQAEAIDQDVAYFSTVEEVTTILKAEGVKQIKSKGKGKSFWYNRSTNMIESKSIDADGTILGVSAASTSVYPFVLEQVSDNPALLYIDVRNNKVTKSLDEIRKYIKELDGTPTDDSFTGKIQVTTENTAVRNHLLKFVPSKTIYVNKNGCFTANTSKSVDSVVFSEGLTSITDTNTLPDTYHVNESVYIPTTITSIAPTCVLGKLDPDSEILIQNKELLEPVYTKCVVTVQDNTSTVLKVRLTYSYFAIYTSTDKTGKVQVAIKTTSGDPSYHDLILTKTRKLFFKEYTVDNNKVYTISQNGVEYLIKDDTTEDLVFEEIKVAVDQDRVTELPQFANLSLDLKGLDPELVKGAKTIINNVMEDKVNVLTIYLQKDNVMFAYGKIKYYNVNIYDIVLSKVVESN